MGEAMILDSGKPVSHTTDDQQPLHTRQIQLATLVQNMITRSTPQEVAATRIMNRKRTKIANKDQPPMGYNGVGRVVIDIHDKNVVISSPRGMLDI
jgi:hypothetical protein